jgi:hypothetical protein
MTTAVAMAKKPRKRLVNLLVSESQVDGNHVYMLMNKAQVSVSTAARQTGHLRFQIAMSCSDRRTPNLSNRLAGECTAGMVSSLNFDIEDFGCLRKLATASPTVAEKSQSSVSQGAATSYLRVESHATPPG